MWGGDDEVRWRCGAVVMWGSGGGDDDDND